MNKLIIIVFLVVSHFSESKALTPPVEILPLSLSLQSVDFYQEQILLWEDYIVTNPEDSKAWLNYYTAARNLNILSRVTKYDLANIATKVNMAAPNSFENHYIKYKQSDPFNRDYNALFKAIEFDSTQFIAHQELLFYSKMNNDKGAIREYAKRLYHSGKISIGILEWNYNALHSVEKNAILLTHGDNDTYPSWVLQEMKGIREDVKVINLFDLLAEEKYRKFVFSELGIQKEFKLKSEIDGDNGMKKLIDHLYQNGNYPIYLGVATPSKTRKAMGRHLYLTGLAFQHNEEKIDNLKVLDSNYQKRFKLEALREPLVFDPSQSVVNHMNMNYIPSFTLLYDYYVDQDRSTEAKETEVLIKTIARRADKGYEVDRIFKLKKGKKRKGEISMDMRTIDDQLMRVEDNLYASSLETTNGHYNAFLYDLLKKRRYEDLEVCQIHETNWLKYLPEEFRHLSDEVLFKRGYPDSEDHPVVNISYEAAELYCQWLTDRYNKSDHRRKRFKKVLFRLPTQAEWTTAAQSGKNNKYPWGGPNHINNKGCQLTNYNPYYKKDHDSKEYTITGIPGDDDGAYFTVPTDAYFPNDLGLFLMAGNVAEMTLKKGITKGGGWNDPAYYIETNSYNNESIPSPNVGFRIFMDLVESLK